jgi:hypothetical protein
MEDSNYDGCLWPSLSLAGFLIGLIVAFIFFADMPRDWDQPYLGQTLSYATFFGCTAAGVVLVAMFVLAWKVERGPTKVVLLITCIGLCLGILLGTACAGTTFH